MLTLPPKNCGIEGPGEYCYIPACSTVCLRPGQYARSRSGRSIPTLFESLNAESPIISGYGDRILPDWNGRRRKRQLTGNRENKNRTENRRATSRRIFTSTQGRAVQHTNTTWDPGTRVNLKTDNMRQQTLTLHDTSLPSGRRTVGGGLGTPGRLPAGIWFVWPSACSWNKGPTARKFCFA